MKLVGDLLCNHMQLKDAVAHSGDTFPADAVEGQWFYRSDLHELYYYNGTTWNQILVGSGGGGGGVGSGHVTTLIVDATSDLGRHVYIRDEMITLNHGETGAGILQWGTTRGGIEIDRGTSPMVSLFYDELDDTWKLTNDGATDEIIITETNDSVFLRLDGSNTPTADVSWNLHKITNLGDPTDSKDAVNKDYVDSLIGSGVFLALDGSNSPTADISWNNHKITDLADPTNPQDAVNLQYLQNYVTTDGSLVFLRLDGSNSPTNNISWNNNKITDLAAPTDPNDAVRKDYVDGIANNLPNLYIARNGSNSPTADISWGGYKITNLADPVNNGDAVNRGFVYSNFALVGHTHDYSTILNRPEDDNFHSLAEKSTIDDNDELLIYDVSTATYKRVKRSTLLSGSLTPTSNLDVFMFGGFDGSNYLTNNNAYNSSTDSWTVLVTDMNPPGRSNFGATTINNEIYVVNGYNGAYFVLNERYEISLDSWTSRTDTPNPSRADNNVVGDSSDKVYTVHGYNASGYIADLDSYSVSTDSWISLQDSDLNRTSSGSGYISDKIYSFAGYDGTNILSDGRQYDVTTDTWSTVSSLPGVVRDSGYSVIDTNKLMLTTGYNGVTQIRDSYIYDPSIDSWSSATQSPLPARSDASYSVYNNTIGLLTGGFDGTYYLRDADAYDCVTDSWSSKTNTPTPGRQDHCSSNQT